MGFIDRPQELKWRKLLFQIHLWCGLVIGAILLVVGLTGSILVYYHELSEAQSPVVQPQPGKPRVNLVLLGRRADGIVIHSRRQPAHGVQAGFRFLDLEQSAIQLEDEGILKSRWQTGYAAPELSVRLLPDALAPGCGMNLRGPGSRGGCPVQEPGRSRKYPVARARLTS